MANTDKYLRIIDDNREMSCSLNKLYFIHTKYMHLKLYERVKIGNVPIEGGLQIELR